MTCIVEICLPKCWNFFFFEIYQTKTPERSPPPNLKWPHNFMTAQTAHCAWQSVFFHVCPFHLTLFLKNTTFDLDKKRRTPAFTKDDIKAKKEKYCYLYLLLFWFWWLTFFIFVVFHLLIHWNVLVLLLLRFIFVVYSISKRQVALRSRTVRRIAFGCCWWSIRSVACCLRRFGSSGCSGPRAVERATQAFEVEVTELYQTPGTQKLVEQGKE